MKKKIMLQQQQQNKKLVNLIMKLGQIVFIVKAI